MSHLTVPERDADTATTGAHVTGRFFDLYITDVSVRLEGWILHTVNFSNQLKINLTLVY